MKSTKRLIAIYDHMAHLDREGGGEWLCIVAKDIAELTGAGISLDAGDAAPITPLCASDEVARSLLNLEVTLGEGPCIGSLRSEAVVDQPDLSAPIGDDLLLYAPLALAIGARAVFGFPVRIGAIQFGALGLYRDQPGELSESQRSDGYLLASVIGRSVLAMQSGADRGKLSAELRNKTMFEFSVHQATGMVAIQGAMSIKDALVTLRMHAYACDMNLEELAALVIARQIRYDASGRTWAL
ncbi:MAG: hypothetical protein ACYDEH_00850 [Acidimicrobiales bacterium]